MDILDEVAPLLGAIVFAALAAGVYRWFRRRDPASRAQAWKVFLVLLAIIAVRLYAVAD
ncbi:MAG: hypothetical protein JWN93_3993 [Hyphomicrobiales bacterium]|nr:hypothetical protein [Hyphomicrobiales bacterium]